MRKEELLLQLWKDLKWSYSRDCF